MEEFMKVLLYTEMAKKVSKSGLGLAIEHQKTALTNEGIEWTIDPNDDYDILHINTWFPKSYFFAKKAKKNGKKIVYHAHSTEEDYRDGFIFARQTSKIVKWWLIKCYSLGHVIVTPTLYSKKLLEGYKGLEKKKIYAISNGIDMELFKKNKEAGEAFRKKYGYTKNDKVIIGIGLYIRRKGIVDFVELARRLPEYKFIWFGYSSLKAATSDVREAVNTKLPNLTWAGYVPQIEIKAAMSGADLYLFPTLEETEGIPIIEACATKQNAIIRDIPIFDGWLEDGKNVYKAKDVDAFEKKIKDFFDGKLPSLVDEAYKVAIERDIKTIGKQLKKVYEEVLKME
jgi:1,2-diacylglycerol-3-alpha-glucose alpha-1,2-glucosyltransferase